MKDPPNVHKLEEVGVWVAQGYTVAGREYFHAFPTWQQALQCANELAMTFELPAVAPTHTHGGCCGLWKIRKGINVRAIRTNSFDLTVGKERVRLTHNEVQKLTRALLSATVAIGYVPKQRIKRYAK